jgi:hypothetical protein
MMEAILAKGHLIEPLLWMKKTRMPSSMHFRTRLEKCTQNTSISSRKKMLRSMLSNLKHRVSLAMRDKM